MVAVAWRTCIERPALRTGVSAGWRRVSVAQFGRIRGGARTTGLVPAHGAASYPLGEAVLQPGHGFPGPGTDPAWRMAGAQMLDPTSQVSCNRAQASMGPAEHNRPALARAGLGLVMALLVDSDQTAGQGPRILTGQKKVANCLGCLGWARAKVQAARDLSTEACP